MSGFLSTQSEKSVCGSLVYTIGPSSHKNKAGLDDTDHPEIGNLSLQKEHWITLSNIKKVLKPFERYTQQVSKKAPSLHMSVKMYCTEPKAIHRRPAGNGPGRSMLYSTQPGNSY